MGKSYRDSNFTLDFLPNRLTHQIALGLSLFSCCGFLLWLPFQRHEAQQKKHSNEIENKH